MNYPGKFIVPLLRIFISRRNWKVLDREQFFHVNFTLVNILKNKENIGKAKIKSPKVFENRYKRYKMKKYRIILARTKRRVE